MEKSKVIQILVAAVGHAYQCPSGVIAQLILEVGWDLKTPKDYKTGKESYNLGNIKGAGPAGSVTCLTTEYYTSAQVAAAQKAKKLVSKTSVGGGKWKCQIYDQFKAYHNYTEAVADHLDFLHGARYQSAGVLKATTPESYAKSLQAAGYATDPNYAKSIVSIVDSNNLRAYDKKPVKPNSAVMWDGMELKKGQIGRLTILKPINLWQRVGSKLVKVRVLQPGEVYRVYGYDTLHGGQYNLGGTYVTKMDGYIKYETPSKALLAKVK